MNRQPRAGRWWRVRARGWRARCCCGALFVGVLIEHAAVRACRAMRNTTRRPCGNGSRSRRGSERRCRRWCASTWKRRPRRTASPTAARPDRGNPRAPGIAVQPDQDVLRASCRCSRPSIGWRWSSEPESVRRLPRSSGNRTSPVRGIPTRCSGLDYPILGPGDTGRLLHSSINCTPTTSGSASSRHAASGCAGSASWRWWPRSWPSRGSCWCSAERDRERQRAAGRSSRSTRPSACCWRRTAPSGGRAAAGGRRAQPAGTAPGHAGGRAPGPGAEVAAVRQHRHHGRLVRPQHQEPAGAAQRSAAPLPGGGRPVRAIRSSMLHEVRADARHRDRAACSRSCGRCAATRTGRS